MSARTLAGITPGLSLSVAWAPSKRLTPAVNRPIRAIVIHTAECRETNTAAEALASWDAGPNAPRASWHFAVDADSVTQSVDCLNTAWHATVVNSQTIGVEHAGFAAQTPDGWSDDYSKRMLENSARLVAILCERYSIPAIRPTLADVSRSWQSQGKMTPGIVGHWDITRAIPGSGTHTDPGIWFPWEAYLLRVRELAPGAPRP